MPGVTDQDGGATTTHGEHHAGVHAVQGVERELPSHDPPADGIICIRGPLKPLSPTNLACAGPASSDGRFTAVPGLG